MQKHASQEEKHEIAQLLEQLTPPFHKWLPTVTPNFHWDWPYQKFIRKQLGRLTEGEINRLQISMPPQHGKSQMVTVRYAAWRLERDPTLRIGIGAYGQDLANSFSRQIRRIIEDRCPEIIAKDANNVADWETVEGGGVRAAGIIGGITGRPLDLIILDDPVKNRMEARSETYRNRVWDEYTNSWLTRTSKRAAIVLIQTRWHEDDLAGRIQENEGDDWEYINVPAIAEEDDPLGREEGEPLCPELHPLPKLLKTKLAMGIDWYALYQGRPQNKEGGIIKQQWFRRWEFIEDAGYSVNGMIYPQSALNVFITVDLAISQKDEADNTVVATWGVTPKGDLLLLDCFADHIEGPDIGPLIREQNTKWNADYILIEKVAWQESLIQQERRKGGAIKPFIPKGDKASRLQVAAVRYAAGTVYHPPIAGHAWIREFEEELLQFPNGKHDDRCDATSMACIEVGKRYGDPEFEVDDEGNVVTPDQSPQHATIAEPEYFEPDGGDAQKALMSFLFDD